MKIAEFIHKIRVKYNIDIYTLLIYLLLSISFPPIYKIIISLVIGVSIFQFYRITQNKVEVYYVLNSFIYLMIFSLIFFRSTHTAILVLTIILSFLVKKQGNSTNSVVTFEVYILFFFGFILLNFLVNNPSLKDIDTFFYLILYPTLFITLKKKAIDISIIKILKVYISSVIISTIYLTIINIIYVKNLTITNTNFSYFLDISHVYFGMYIGLAISFILFFKSKNLVYLNKNFDSIIYLILMALLIYTGARASLIATSILTLLTLYKNIRLSAFKKIVFVVMIIISASIISYKTMPRVKAGVDSINNIYINKSSKNQNKFILDSWSNMNQRYLVIEYSLKEIKTNFWLGIGIKNVKNVISDKIINDGYIYFQPINTHNQFLHFLLGMGIFGFLFFIWMLIDFYKKIPNGIYFLIFFILIMQTESILVRIQGISLFFIFYLILSYPVRNNVQNV